ncbi:MAG: heme-copper oxidase subunit III, partial [Acidobacteria bacterium]|nr:heme-copper oxidase subunit III [Acidobacteriota bacterium]
VLPPPIPVERPRPGQGGGGVHPPAHGGGGDNGPGDGSFDYGRRLYRARLGLILALTSISILFVTITVVFLLLRHGSLSLDPRTGNYVRQWVPIELPVGLLLLNTVVLLASSCTIEMARRSIAREMVLAPVRSIPGIALDRELAVPWLAITVTLGALFLVGQWAAWSGLERRGFHIFTGIPSPFFYILTGAHAVHLIGGLMVLVYAGLSSLFHRALEHRRIVIEIAAWYWHFMTVLWIYIFTLLEIGRLGP